MPLTSDDFHVENAGPLDLLKLNLALQYIHTQMPLNGAPIIEALNREFVSIIINHEGKNEYHSNGQIYWDPGKAIVVENAAGQAIGVNSAATILLHEAAHAIDANRAANHGKADPQYNWVNERTAVEATAIAAEEAGEVVRENHYGKYVNALNPTEHTSFADDYPLSLFWVEIDEMTLDIDAGPLTNLDSISGDAPSIGGGFPFAPPRKNPPDEDLPESVPTEPERFEPIGLVGSTNEYHFAAI